MLFLTLIKSGDRIFALSIYKKKPKVVLPV